MRTSSILRALILAGVLVAPLAACELTPAQQSKSLAAAPGQVTPATCGDQQMQQGGGATAATPGC